MKVDDIRERLRKAFGRSRPTGPDTHADPDIAAPATDGLRTDPIPTGPDTPESQYLDEGVIMLGRRKHAINLNWRPYNPEQSLAFQAEQAKASVSLFLTYEFHADLKGRGQIGFAAREISHADRMQVLATAIPERLTGPRWIGAFRIGRTGEHWWLVSIRDGIVYEDSIVHGTIEAIASLREELDAPDWTRIFAPEDWGIRDSTEALIGDVVAPAQAARLRPVRPLVTHAPRIIIAGLLIAGAIAGYFIYEHIQKKAADELARLAREQDRVITVYRVDFPWHERTEIRNFASACRDEIEKSVFLIPGWSAQPISCRIEHGEGIVTAGWSRTTDGRISWLRAAMPEGYPQPSLSAEGQTASLTRSFEAPYIKGVRNVEHWEPSLITSTLRERFQTLGLKLAMKQRRQRVPSRTKHEEPVFNYHEVSISTDFAMEEQVRLFADVPALVPDALVFNVSSGTWTMSAKAYHEPILPPGAEVK